MPYKASGRWVYVKKNGRWVRLKRLESAGQADKYAKALNANVRH